MMRYFRRLLSAKVLCCAPTPVLENLCQDVFSLLLGTLSSPNVQYHFSFSTVCHLVVSSQAHRNFNWGIFIVHCVLFLGLFFYFVLFYFLEHFSKLSGVFSASAIGIAQHCPDNVSAVISCSKYCRISYYIAVRNSCQEKRVSNWFFVEKHGYIYLVCYYKYSSSRLWPGEFQAHWGQWKSGTWLQWSQDFHLDFCLVGELELTMIVDKNPGTTQQFFFFF